MTDPLIPAPGGLGRASREVWVLKVLSANRPAAHWVHRVVSTRSCFHPQVYFDLFRLAVLRDLTISNSSFSHATSSEFLRFDSSLGSPFGPSLTTPRFHPSFATPPPRSHLPRRNPIPSLRSVHRFSQPLDGLLRAWACRLISSRSHVQGLARSGASLLAQPPFLIGRSLPPGRWTRHDSPAFAGCRHARPSTSRPLSTQGRVHSATVIHNDGGRSPHRVSLLQALHFPPWPQLTRDLRSRR